MGYKEVLGAALLGLGAGASQGYGNYYKDKIQSEQDLLKLLGEMRIKQLFEKEDPLRQAQINYYNRIGVQHAPQLSAADQVRIALAELEGKQAGQQVLKERTQGIIQEKAFESPWLRNVNRDVLGGGRYKTSPDIAEVLAASPGSDPLEALGIFRRNVEAGTTQKILSDIFLKDPVANALAIARGKAEIKAKADEIKRLNPSLSLPQFINTMFKGAKQPSADEIAEATEEWDRLYGMPTENSENTDEDFFKKEQELRRRGLIQ